MVPQVGTLCAEERIVADRKEPVLRRIPGPLLGQTLILLGEADFTPYTLHPTPFILYTLHPTSYILHPTP